MNIKIKEQLNKCTVAQIPGFNDLDTEIVIPRLASRNNNSVSFTGLVTNHLYRFSINKSLVYPCDWYYTIHNNWNNGIGPKEEFVEATVIQTMGKMVKINSVGLNQGTTWSGWIPASNLHILN